MIKCEVVKGFNLKNFNDLKNIKRKSLNTQGKLFVGDVFECSEEMVDYLSGNNPLKEAVIKVIEVEPKQKVEEEPKVEVVESEPELNDEEVEPAEEQEIEHIEEPSVEEPQEPEQEETEIKTDKKKKSSKK